MSSSRPLYRSHLDFHFPSIYWMSSPTNISLIMQQMHSKTTAFVMSDNPRQRYTGNFRRFLGSWRWYLYNIQISYPCSRDPRLITAKQLKLNYRLNDIQAQKKLLTLSCLPTFKCIWSLVASQMFKHFLQAEKSNQWTSMTLFPFLNMHLTLIKSS